MAGYDSEAEALLRKWQALGVLLVIIDGRYGNGMSFSVATPELRAALPDVLERMARELRAGKNHMDA